MSNLSHEVPPEGLPDNIKEYLARMFLNVDIALSRGDTLPKLTAPPIRPVTGKIYYFSNAVAAHPVITTAGYYGYTTAWVFLG